MIEIAQAVRPLGFHFVFTGACVLPFLVAPQFVPGLRTTEDVDIIVQILARTHMADVEEKLRSVGFRNDYWSEKNHLCKWLFNEIQVDVLPDHGGPSDWFKFAASTAVDHQITPSVTIQHISAVAFLVTKLDAFEDRGSRDKYGSKDWEDIIALLDGCANLSAEIKQAPVEVREFIASKIQNLILAKHLEDSAPHHLSWESQTAQRGTRLVALLRQLGTTLK